MIFSDRRVCRVHRWWNERSPDWVLWQPDGEGPSGSSMPISVQMIRRNGLHHKTVQVSDLIIYLCNVQSLSFLKCWIFFCLDKDGSQKSAGERAGALAVPRLSVCADAQKVDRAKLAQTEVRFQFSQWRFKWNHLNTHPEQNFNVLLNFLLLIFMLLNFSVFNYRIWPRYVPDIIRLSTHW